MQTASVIFLASMIKDFRICFILLLGRDEITKITNKRLLSDPVDILLKMLWQTFESKNFQKEILYEWNDEKLSSYSIWDFTPNLKTK